MGFMTTVALPIVGLLRTLCFCCLVAVSTASPAAEMARGDGKDAKPLRIGVLAYRGAERARHEWQPHADYLAQKLAPRRFQIVPLTLADFAPAIADRRIDLVITNTGHYVELEVGGKISRIATMRVSGPEGPVDRFGGTAIARADRADMNSYADLRGKRLAVPDTRGFGGWQVHLRDARAAGVDLHRDVAEIL